MAGRVNKLAEMGAKPRTIWRDGKWQEVEMTSFVGVTDEESAQLGIGLADKEGKCHFWALAFPHALITSWRGMQVLDHLEKIGYGTIHHAYFVGERKKDSEVERSMAELKEQLPEIETLREKLLKKPIPDDELDRMLTICNSPESHINVATWELKQEIEAGTIHETRQVKLAFEIEAKEQVRLGQNKARSKVALPAHQSFREFCQRANIQYLCSAPIGAYGWDWGHRDPGEIDEEIIFHGLQYGWSEQIFCTEEPEKADKFGQIGHPVVLLKDGRELVVCYAYYHDDQMWVGVRPVKNEDELTEWKIGELSALGPQMVGITLSRQSKNVTIEEVERGYVLVKRGSMPLWVTKLLQKFRK